MAQVCVDIVEAVAEKRDTDPIDLGYTLEEYIDTDAIEQLANQSATSWSLSFELPGSVVTVTNDRMILVDSTEETGEA